MKKPSNFVEIVGVLERNFVVTHIKELQEDKRKHKKTLMLLKLILDEVDKLKKSSDVVLHFGPAFIRAGLNDTYEVVDEILEYFPRAIWTIQNNCFISQLALTNRCENVFNFLIHKLSLSHEDHVCKVNRNPERNKLLHFAAKLAPIEKLNLVSGAALQMQRELQWFEAIKKYSLPSDNEEKNNKQETPFMIFRREHENLRKEGEEWMKKTADSYTISAALIITIVFAAAITVPGGTNDDNGKPIYASKRSFIIFAISDAISLFTATTSLLLFLSILTTRFRDEDFLYKLPKRLIFGLTMLFLSVTSLMVAFSATLYLMFGDGRAWILIPIASLACLPVASFVTLQLPLLFDLICSTYSQGIFEKPTKTKKKKIRKIE
ncbi:uncharacterized protein [Rutidosis leptorrhynchoides]|uniref:uncharacterized protein n=1 Tax=Rutidosis leptorrhynchoides TaxID=125765 RepID=UPI003A9A4197